MGAGLSKKFKKAAEKNETTLDLGSKGISALPPEIGCGIKKPFYFVLFGKLLLSLFRYSLFFCG